MPNSQHSPGPAGRAIVSYAVVLVVLLAGAWLRISLADSASVWRDEAQTIAIAGESFPSGILQALEHDGNSPLFYLAEHFLIAGRGSAHRELRDRGLSVALGLICILMVFVAGREIGRRSFAAGITAAVIAAFSPVLIDLSTQARPYAAVAVATVAMALGALRIERDEKGWGLYGSASVLGFYLHAFFATTIASFGVMLLFQSFRAKQLRAWLVAHALMLAAVIPGLLFLHRQVETLTIANGRIPWGTTPTLGRLTRQLMVMLTASEGGPYALVTLVIAIAFLAMAVYGNARARSIAIVAGLSLMTSFLLALRSGGFETRYHIAPLTLALLAISAGAPAIVFWRRFPGRALVTVAIVALGLIGLSGALPGARRPRSSARDVAAVLGAAGANELIVIVPDSIAVGINYYLSPRREQIDPPELDRADRIDFRGWAERLADPKRIKAIDMRVQQAARAKQPLWLVIWQPMLGPPPRLSPRDAEHSALPAQWALGSAVLHSIEAHYKPVTMRRIGPSYEEMVVIGFQPN